MLLNHGAHIDTKNNDFERPNELLKDIPANKINLFQYLTLKCLAARVVAEKKLKYKHEMPKMLEDFIALH
jgi:hypothetical protein